MRVILICRTSSRLLKSTAGRRDDGGGALTGRLAGLIDAALLSLTRWAQGVDTAALTRAAQVLAPPGPIWLIGNKRAFPVAACLSPTLAQHGIANMLIDNTGSGVSDQVSCLGPGDRVLAVSFSLLELDHAGTGDDGPCAGCGTGRVHRQSAGAAGPGRAGGGGIQCRRLPQPGGDDGGGAGPGAGDQRRPHRPALTGCRNNSSLAKMERPFDPRRGAGRI